MRDKNLIASKEVKDALKNLKTEVASELGVNLTSSNLTAKDAGRVGGQMVKRLIESAENQMR